MAGVENRIVTMQFNNREFENNARTSLSTLQKLKESMNFGTITSGTIRGLGAITGALDKIGLRTPFAPLIRAANTGLTGIGTVLDKLGMKNPFSTGVQSAADLQKAAADAGGPRGMGVLEGGVTAVSNKFIALSTIAITALSNITNRAINAGTQFVKGFSIAPLQQGLEEYELNLKSIQVIQANTDRPLTEINKSLDELNKYSDQTIYNFSEMARNIGTFTAAGVDLQTSTSAIKGIANMAALSGSSSQQASTAMYQLSQAIASGKVSLMDWNSVVNAGMGGKKLQGALAQTAVAMGQLTAEQVKGVKTGEQLKIAGQSFRESIMAAGGATDSAWLSSEVLVNTLASLDGRFSMSALMAERTKDGLQKYTKAQAEAVIQDNRAAMEKKNGIKYTDEQFKALQKLSTSAFKSATEVKTLGQVFEVAKETMGSGWSATFRNIFGDLKEAKALFTPMSEALNGIIDENSIARNKILAEWKDLGGRDYLIKGFKNAWVALTRIVKPIKEAFRDIFPAKTAGQLTSMTRQFMALTDRMKPSKDTMAAIRDIAGGVFAVFSIGKTIIGGIVDGFKALFDAVGGGNGDFLDFAAGIGRAIQDFDTFLQKSGIVTAFFEGLGNILSIPINMIKGLATGFASVFGGFSGGDGEKAAGTIQRVSDSLGSLNDVGDGVRRTFEKIGEFFGNLGGMIGNALAGIGDILAGVLTSDAFGPALDAVNTGLLAAITTMIVKWVRGGSSIDLTGGIFGQITGMLEGVTGTLEAMQTSLKADALLKIGIAIGVIAAALLVLSTIDPADMRLALGAMAAGLAVLIGAMAAMMKVLGPTGLIQLNLTAAALVTMSIGVLALAGAIKVLSSIEFGHMLRGLVGMGIMLAIIKKAMIPLAKGAGGMMRAAASLILVGIAINLLAIALKVFATMSWEEMIKGLAGLTGVLIALSIGLKAMPPMQAEAIGLIALGIAVNLLAAALKIFATMSWEEMAKGLLMLTGALVGIAIGINMMPKTMMLQAIALVAVAGAMTILAGALKIMGSMGWEEIAKGMVVLAGSMIILAVGLNAIGIMGSVGAVGLLLAATALGVLLPTILAFGAMDWTTMLKSLAMLAGIFVILGLAAVVLGPLTPVLIGLSAAILILGAGLMLMGAGALAAATAFGIVVAAGTAGAQVLMHILQTIIGAIPPALAAFGEGMVRFAQAIGEGAPKIATAFGKVVIALLDQAIKAIPKMMKVMTLLVNAAVKVLVHSVPKLADAGLKMIIGLLTALSNNMPKIMDKGAEVIVKFLQGIGRNADDIIQAGSDMILDLLHGIAKTIRHDAWKYEAAGWDIADAIVNGAVKGISNLGGKIKDLLLGWAKDAWNAAKDFLGIDSPSKLMEKTIGEPMMQGWMVGINRNGDLPTKALTAVGQTAVDTLQDTMSRVSDAFALNADLDPTITPVLDLTKLTQEANKMSSILATAPIMPTTSYATAADISAMTQSFPGPDDGTDGSGGGGGGTNITLEQHLHSPRPIDSVESYRAGKTLISLAKEALDK